MPVANGGTGAVTAANARTNLGAVNVAGDTMTGDLSIVHAGANLFRVDSTNDNAALLLDKGASTGKICAINAYTNNVIRWQMALGDPTNESGSNAGSDFNIARFSDAGSSLATAFSIRRSDGLVTIPGSITSSSNASFAGVQLVGGGGSTISNTSSGLSGSIYFNNFCVAVVQGSTGVLSYQHQPGSFAQWQVQVNGTANYTFPTTGRAQAPVAWDVVSDERLKRNFRPVKGMLDLVDLIEVETYERVDEPVSDVGPCRPVRHAGVRAQRMRMVLAESVHVAGTPDLPDRLTVATDGAGLIALATVKELKALVLSLRAELAALKAA